MTQTRFEVKISDGLGDGRTGLTVVASDVTGAFGVRRTDITPPGAGYIVVADGTAMAEVGGGFYRLMIDDPTTDLTYEGWSEYTFQGETHRAGYTFAGTTSDAASAPATRVWDSIISYEDRDNYTTSRWRLKGIVTKEGAGNTDNGVLWAQLSAAGDTVTVNVYKDDGLANLVATGSADVSGTDSTGENAAEVDLSASNSSGITGTMWIHEYVSAGSHPVQVALCVDEDLDVLWDPIEGLTLYDSTTGLAEAIRFATGDVMSYVMGLYQDNLGGHGTREVWYIEDATRTFPDLRRIANPEQLRNAASFRALVIAIGRDHQRADDTAFSELRDYFAEQYESALNSLQLAFKPGNSGDATESATSTAVRLDRA